MIIVGAGLSGLIAAHSFPKAQVVEANQAVESHKALLRFRSKAVSDLVGVPFQEVTVRKGIFFRGSFRPVNVALANCYARKCLGSLVGDRSIWNQEPAQRFIAPEDLYAELVDNLGTRVAWESPFDYADQLRWRPKDSYINTAPLPVALKSLGIEAPEGTSFNRAGITVRRWRIPGANVFQTIYFPDPEHSLYRASITGDMLIAEFMESGPDHAEWRVDLQSAFAINLLDAEAIGEFTQRYGKIAPIHDGTRRAMLHDLSVKYGIYSLGRFATWRNILLDDLINDIDVVKKLMRNDDYSGRITRK